MNERELFLSALEIEEVLRTHPAIVECAVVGVEDPAWGAQVCTAIVCTPGQFLSLQRDHKR